MDAFHRLNDKVGMMLTDCLDEYKLSEEEAANREKFKVVAMVTVRHAA